MQEPQSSLTESLADLRPGAWKNRLMEIARADGMAQDLGDDHFATLLDRGKTLLVTFETMQGIRGMTDDHLPFGFEPVRRHGWSHLCLISNGDTWFRDPRVFGFFDRLIDDGFFEDFDRVVFYGAGPCGYAAAAFSVSAPGATVIAVQPQATLDPRVTEWDDRFTDMRRTSFTDRYGYAPDMLDAAARAYVIYDPCEQLDAMHATLFRRANVRRLRMRNMGGALQTRLLEMNLLFRLLSLAGKGKFTSRSFYQLYRARRAYPTYLKNLSARLSRNDRFYLEVLLCRNVLARMPLRRLRRRGRELQRMADDGAFTLPPPHKQA